MNAERHPTMSATHNSSTAKTNQSVGVGVSVSYVCKSMYWLHNDDAIHVDIYYIHVHVHDMWKCNGACTASCMCVTQLHYLRAHACAHLQARCVTWGDLWWLRPIFWAACYRVSLHSAAQRSRHCKSSLNRLLRVGRGVTWRA